MNGRTFRRIAAISAIISAPLALGASITLLMAIDFNAEIVSDPANLITLGERAAGTFRWVEFAGLLGYYLLVVPATLYLWRWLQPRQPDLVNLYTIFGLASIFNGAIGSTLLISALPSLMSAYGEASGAQGEQLVTLFRAIMDSVVVGLLPVAGLLSGVWWLGIGLILRAGRPAFGLATAILGIVHLAYGAGAALQIELLASHEALTFLAPLWALWLGVIIWRHGEQGEREHAAAVAA